MANGRPVVASLVSCVRKISWPLEVNVSKLQCGREGLRWRVTWEQFGLKPDVPTVKETGNVMKRKLSDTNSEFF